MILFQYLLKLSVCLAVVFLFYQLVLRRLTFYNRNRWYLLGYSVLSFLIPLMNITGVLEKNEWTNNEVVNMIPAIEKFTSPVNSAELITASAQWTVWDWALLLFTLGVIVLFVKLCVQLFSFYRLFKKTQLLSKDEVKLYQVNDDIIPFSFGKAIFVNRNLHSEEELTKIIRHEFVHVRQRHIIDVMWSEVLCILNWYNPFAWFIRKAIRQNLEFIADNKVLEEGVDKKQYQYLLLKVMGNKEFSIANQFNFSSLKKRIAMMNKTKSARMHLLRFLFLLPVVAVLLLSFRKNYSRILHGVHTAQIASAIKDTVPEEKKNPYPEIVASFSLHRDDAMSDLYRTFFDKNENVNLLHWSDKGFVEVYKKNADVEKYQLPADLAKFESKYGKLPPPKGTRIATREGGFVIIGPDKILPSKTIAVGEDNSYGEGVSVAGGESIGADEVLVATTADLKPITVVGTKLGTPVSVGIATTLPPRTISDIAPTTTIVPDNNVKLGKVDAITVIDRPMMTVRDKVAVAGVIPEIDTDIKGDIILELKIYKGMSKSDLDKLIKKAKDVDAVLSFDKTGFNDKGQLTSVSGDLRKADTHTGFQVTDFEVITMIITKYDGKFHSYLYTNDKKERS